MTLAHRESSSAAQLRVAAAALRPGAARYLYGLIRTVEHRDFGSIGLEEHGERTRVYTIRVGSVGAVVSDHPVVERLLPLRANLEGHHRVIRDVMATVTILPMSFGHLAASDDEVRRLVMQHGQSIAAALDRIDGKAEMALRVEWDVDNVFEHLVSVERELAAHRDRLFGGSHPPSMAERVELGRTFAQCLDDRREEVGERVLAGLQPCAIDARSNPPKNEKVVMDASFLVARDSTREFEDAVYRVAAGFPSSYVFDYSGPWAPFHFVELDLRRAAA